MRIAAARSTDWFSAGADGAAAEPDGGGETELAEAADNGCREPKATRRMQELKGFIEVGVDA